MACELCGSDTHPLAGYCPQDEKNWRTVQVAPQGLVDKETQRQLKLYEKAKFEGNQPQGTGIDRRTGYTHSEVAMAFADKTGRPYDAADKVGSLYPEYKELIKELSPEQKAQALAESRSG